MTLSWARSARLLVALGRGAGRGSHRRRVVRARAAEPRSGLLVRGEHGSPRDDLHLASLVVLVRGKGVLCRRCSRSRRTSRRSPRSFFRRSRSSCSGPRRRRRPGAAGWPESRPTRARGARHRRAFPRARRVGGSGDPVAPLPGRLLQLASGLVHIGTGDAFLPEALAWGTGACALARCWRFGRCEKSGAPPRRSSFHSRQASRRCSRRGGSSARAISTFPPWGLPGPRARRSRPGRDRWSSLWRRSFSRSAVFRPRVVAERSSPTRRASARPDAPCASARAAPACPTCPGRRLKDLDLAVKEDPALVDLSNELLVLADVPASFVMMPPAFASRAAGLVAAPPLPPSGAYRFGDRSIVGLSAPRGRARARRGHRAVSRHPVPAPAPPTPGGHVIARDVTEELKARRPRRVLLRAVVRAVAELENERAPSPSAACSRSWRRRETRALSR